MKNQILEITNNSDYGWIDLDGSDADRIRVILTKALSIAKVGDRLPEDTAIRDNAREMDEKEFEHWWWETVYKGN